MNKTQNKKKMTKEKKTQIKKFLDKVGDKLNIPFLKKTNKSSKVLNIFQKTMEILPNLLKKKKNEDEFSPKLSILSEFKQNQRSILPKLANSPSQIKVLLPIEEKNKLISWSKSRKINNVTHIDGNNGYVLKLPAFEDGRKPINQRRERLLAESREIGNKVMSNLAHIMSPTGDKETIEETKNEIQGAGAGILKPIQNNLTAKSKEVEAKLEPSAITAGGNEGAKVAVVAEKPGTPPTAALVGESGKEKINQSTGEITPVKNLTEQTSSELSLVEEKNENNENNASLKMAETASKGTLGSGSIKALSALGGGKGKALSSIMSSFKGLNKGGVLNSLGKLMSGSSAGGIGAAASGMGAAAGGIGAAAGAAGGLAGGLLPAAAGIAGGLAGGMLPAAALGGVAAGVGGIAAGIGGVASGVGSAIGGIASGLGKGLGMMAAASPFSMMMDAMGGKDKQSPVLVNASSGSPMHVTNITYNYDIYRKTADDAFMLPNFRREYG